MKFALPIIVFCISLLTISFSTKRLQKEIKKEQMILLLIQKEATNKIKRGENEARTLHHINIVRQFSERSVPMKEEKTIFDIPAGLKKEDVCIIAFIQNKSSGKITG